MTSIAAAEGRRRPAFSARLAGVALGVAAVLAGALTPVSVANAQDGPVSLIRDTEIEAILHEDTDPILRAAGLDPKAVTIHIVGDKDMNAFVAGGQHLFLNTGLIVRTKNPNELSGVIAHEIGHMAGGHLVRQQEGERQALATFLLTMGLGMVAAIAGSPEAAAGLIYSSGYFAALTAAGFTRTQEASADQAAVTYLEHAGESSRGLVEFFDNFRYEEVFSEAKRYRFFIDHPLTSERIEGLRVRAAQQPHFNVVDSPESIAKHQIMVAKLKAFMNYPQQTFIDYPETDQSFPARYARAIAYYRDLQTEKALRMTEALIAEHPDNPYLYELKGQTLFEIGRAAEAEPAHRKSVELNPNSALLRMNLGQALLTEDNPVKLDEAVVQIHRSLTMEPENPYGWFLLARAYDRKGVPGMASLATSEQYYFLGQASEAKIFAMRARRVLSRNSPEWRRATDIVLVSNPSRQDLQALAGDGGGEGPARR